MTDIIDKITALRAKVPENGATEDEALASLAAADRLMAKHGITEADLNKVEFSRDMRDGTKTQKQKQKHPVVKFCAVHIMAFCDVTGWYETDTKKTHFFGFDQDVAMAEFLFDLIMNSMDRGWKEFLAANPKQPGVSRHTQYWSFMMGFGKVINDKIKALIDARPVPTTGTDLVANKMALVEEGLKAMLPTLKTKRPPNRARGVYREDIEKGKAAGDKVNLNRPVEAKAQESRKAIS